MFSEKSASSTGPFAVSTVGASGPNTNLLKRIVGKGASDPNANQNQREPERAPAESGPSIIKCCQRERSKGLATCGGALGVLLVLVRVWIACPLPNCALLTG